MDISALIPMDFGSNLGTIKVKKVLGFSASLI